MGAPLLIVAQSVTRRLYRFSLRGVAFRFLLFFLLEQFFLRYCEHLAHGIVGASKNLFCRARVERVMVSWGASLRYCFF